MLRYEQSQFWALSLAGSFIASRSAAGMIGSLASTVPRANPKTELRSFRDHRHQTRQGHRYAREIPPRHLHCWCRCRNTRAAQGWAGLHTRRPVQYSDMLPGRPRGRSANRLAYAAHECGYDPRRTQAAFGAVSTPQGDNPATRSQHVRELYPKSQVLRRDGLPLVANLLDPYFGASMFPMRTSRSPSLTTFWLASGDFFYRVNQSPRTGRLWHPSAERQFRLGKSTSLRLTTAPSHPSSGGPLSHGDYLTDLR
jgi:hypothetical protein